MLTHYTWAFSMTLLLLLLLFQKTSEQNTDFFKAKIFSKNILNDMKKLSEERQRVRMIKKYNYEGIT